MKKRRIIQPHPMDRTANWCSHGGLLVHSGPQFAPWLLNQIPMAAQSNTQGNAVHQQTRV